MIPSPLTRTCQRDNLDNLHLLDHIHGVRCTYQYQYSSRSDNPLQEGVKTGVIAFLIVILVAIDFVLVGIIVLVVDHILLL
jgi:hypothetical protein